MHARKRSLQKRYDKDVKDSPKDLCVFCEIKPNDDQFIDQTKYFMVVKNIYPYSVWDGQGVLDHIMIMPKRHTVAVADFNKNELEDFNQLLQKYDLLDYDFAGRTAKSKGKSIAHQHTHLIKTDGKKKKIIFFNKSPHLLLFR